MINWIGAYIFSLLLFALFVERRRMREKVASLERLPMWGRVLLCPFLLYLALQHAGLISSKSDVSVLWILYVLVAGFTTWMHEAGHIYFRLFGNFMWYFGGTLNELLFPALLAYWAHRQRFVVLRALAVTWIGLNLLKSSHYIGDARAMKLKLLGMGDTSGHDWNHMLGMLGLLESDYVIAAAATSMGCLVVMAGMALLFMPAQLSRGE